MKHLVVVVSAVLLLFSCKKDLEYKAPTTLQSTRQLFFDNIQNKLKDSLSAGDYSKVNFTQLFKSKDVQSNSYFVRIGLLNKSFETDFILLKTDSLGNIMGGRLVHVDKEMSNTHRKKKFNGSFTISSLNRKHNNTQEVANGKWRVAPDATAKAQPTEGDDEPAGEQTLPDVVVTSYIDGGASMDWYWLEGLYSGGGGSVTNTYTYGATTGGGGNDDNGVSTDSTIDIELEVTDDVTIDVSEYLKCFSSIPDANASYQITILSDVPVNSEPSYMFNPTTKSPGHSFIQLRKTDGTNSVQQNIGFYPNVDLKSLTRLSVDSKVVDNEGHEYNASLAMNVNATQFQAALDKMQSIAGNDYNIEKWNCTDFALSIFNAAAEMPLVIPKFIIPGDLYPSNTPQGLYTTIKNLSTSNNTNHGTPDVPGVCGYVGDSHGACK